MTHRNDKSHEEWIRIRNMSLVESEDYVRARDHAGDIVGEVNNIQVANLSDLIKAYKIETDKNIKSNWTLAVISLSIAVCALLFQLIDILKSPTNNQPRINVVQICMKDSYSKCLEF